MKSIKLKIKKLSKDCIIPKYQSSKASGLDIHACIKKEIKIKKKERKIINSGFALSIPSGYELQIRPRSGLALKHGITLLNSPGTIDSDYRGEIKIIIINLGNEDFYIKPGDRIAQMVIATSYKIDFIESDNIDDTVRSSNGFGSTGLR